MSAPPHDASHIARTTLAHYEQRAPAFWAGTRDHDVRQNIDALLGAIDAPRPYELLDLGCGPGRDLKTFCDLGHRAIGLDGCASFVAMAAAYSGCEVWHQNLLELRLPGGRFDGIFANAVLFHVPSAELPRVLGELRAALKPDGVLFASNPRGQGEEGWSGGRYGVFHDLAGWRRYMTGAGFAELRHYLRPAGLPIEQQPWLASVWRNPGAPPRRLTPAAPAP